VGRVRALARGHDRHDGALTTLLLECEDALGDRRAVAERAREHDEAATRERRGDAPPFGDGSTTGPSSSSKASRPVKLVGEGEGPGSPRRPATTPPRRSASAAAPWGSPPGHGAIATPCSTAATTAVVKESTSTTTTTCAPGRMRSAPATPQSNRTWYFACPNGVLESFTGSG
jgi:hypothetical protein